MENVHTFPVPSGVLSLAMSNDDKRIAIGTIGSGLIVRGRGDGMEALETALQVQQYENDPLAKYDADVKEFMESRKKLRYMTEAQALGGEKYIKYGSRQWEIRGQSLKLPENVKVADLKPHTKV